MFPVRAVFGLLLAIAMSTSATPPPAGTLIVHPVDRALMVYVPAGEFVMGMDKAEANALAVALGYPNYHAIAAEEWFPKRKEWLKGYFIDRYETTNERWQRFVASSGFSVREVMAAHQAASAPHRVPLLPVVHVLWADAQRYANWAGKSLPTESQWEKAARGTDGRWFPWGNALPTVERGIFVNLTTNRPTQVATVGSRPSGVSPFGCFDMAGNVYEWTANWHEPYPNNPEAHRMYAYSGHQNGCLRGGSFYHARHAYATVKRFGLPPDETHFHVGFRTVWVPPDGYFESAAFRQAKNGVAEREREIAELRERANAVTDE